MLAEGKTFFDEYPITMSLFSTVGLFIIWRLITSIFEDGVECAGRVGGNLALLFGAIVTIVVVAGLCYIAGLLGIGPK